MKVYNQQVELMVEPAAIQAKTKAPLSLQKQLARVGIEVEAVDTKKTKLPARKAAAAKAIQDSTPQRLYVKTRVKDTEMHPWDVAHTAFDATKGQTSFIEPDLPQEFVTNINTNAAYKRKDMDALAGNAEDTGYDPDWAPHKNTIWHLGNDFSQLKSAREQVMGTNDNGFVVRIGHLDTGYDLTHSVVPASAKSNPLQRNFVDGENLTDAHDPRLGGTGRMPGHGTGTLGILAGNQVQLTTDDGVFNDYLGGAPFANIICCRVSPSVILFKTSAFAEAINYLVDLCRSGTQVHVVSMSMGGAPSKAWADAVNAAYEAGITLVTASGNNFNGVPTTHVVYPARFGRVIAACGVTNDLKPYYSKKLKEMQGCFGPEKYMSKALAGFTPNTPWARGSESVISFSGAGTSSATPQIAAAAAIYYKKYHTQLDAMPGWKRVEAIRNALYKSASQTAHPNKDDSFREDFGNGIIKALDALKIAPADIATPTPEDAIPVFPILTTIFKAMPKEGIQPNAKTLMYNTELAQLVYYYPYLAAIIGGEGKNFDKVSDKKWKKFKDAVIQHPNTSTALKNYLIMTEMNH